MLKIKFSKEWDKLKAKKFKKGEIFTTFRVYTPRKRKYYFERLVNRDNELFDVQLNGELIGKARLVSVDDRWSHSITPSEIEKDTYQGWTTREFKDFLEKFYESEDVFGLWMKFRVEEVYKR